LIDQAIIELRSQFWLKAGVDLPRKIDRPSVAGLPGPASGASIE